VHPIEHLRYVARSRGGDPADLAREAAMALGSLRADPANLVVASRRIVGRHPDAGQMWWLCARLLVADDPSSLAWELADLLHDDPVVDVLVGCLPAGADIVTVGNPSAVGAALADRDDLRVWCADGEHRAGDLVRRLDRAEVECAPITSDELARVVDRADGVVLEAAAACAQRVLVPVGSRTVAVVARSSGTPVWLVTPTGTRLPSQYVDEVARRSIPGDGWTATLEELPLDLVDSVVNVDGLSSNVPVALRPECPLAPELLRQGIV
jgi:hypothetical protein